MSDAAGPGEASANACPEADAGGCDWDGGFIATNIEFVADSFAPSTPQQK
jgi:hypothetical protein